MKDLWWVEVNEVGSRALTKFILKQIKQIRLRKIEKCFHEMNIRFSACTDISLLTESAIAAVFYHRTQRLKLLWYIKWTFQHQSSECSSSYFTYNIWKSFLAVEAGPNKANYFTFVTTLVQFLNKISGGELWNVFNLDNRYFLDFFYHQMTLLAFLVWQNLQSPDREFL